LNECEGLIKQLEFIVAAPLADPEMLARLVRSLASSTVPAPRELPPKLLDRLRQMANLNGGKVQLFGRLFAQWMHHAYPRECPFPHESGSVSPLDAHQLINEASLIRHTLSQSELQASVEKDHCPAEGPCDLDHVDLPWSDIEELYADDHSAPSTSHFGEHLVMLPILILVVVVIIGFLFSADGRNNHRIVSKPLALFLLVLSVIVVGCLLWVDPSIGVILVFGVACQKLITSTNARCVQHGASYKAKNKMKVDFDDSSSTEIL